MTLPLHFLFGSLGLRLHTPQRVYFIKYIKQEIMSYLKKVNGVFDTTGVSVWSPQIPVTPL